MIYAAIKPIEEYDVFVPDMGRKVGIYSSYGHHPALLALIMIATPIPYDYEVDVPLSQKRVSFKNIDPYLDSLKFEIAGQPLGVILKTMNPMEARELLLLADVSKLPLTLEAFYGNATLFNSMVGVRAAAWAMAYRGKVECIGNVVKAAFGGKRSAFNISELDKLTNQCIKEKLLNENRA